MEGERKRSRLLAITGWVVLLLVIYALSIGPVDWVFDKLQVTGNGIVMRTAAIFYWPLTWVVEHTGMHHLMTEYLKLFVPDNTAD